MRLIYFRMRPSFLSSSLSVSLNIVTRNAKAVTMSGQSRFYRNIKFATIVWKVGVSLLFSLCLFFIPERWFSAGMITSPWIFWEGHPLFSLDIPSYLFLPSRAGENLDSYPSSNVLYLGGLLVTLLSYITC